MVDSDPRAELRRSAGGDRAATGDGRMTKLLHRVASVALDATSVASVRVVATGEASSGGWTRVRLARRRDAPADGMIHLDFLGEEPMGVVIQALQPAMAALVVARRGRGVVVRAADNAMKAYSQAARLDALLAALLQELELQALDLGEPRPLMRQQMVHLVVQMADLELGLEGPPHSRRARAGGPSPLLPLLAHHDHLRLKFPAAMQDSTRLSRM